MPSPAAIEKKEEDDFQIHSEGGATELGAVSALLNHPGRVQGRSRWGAGALGTLHDQSSPSLLSFSRAGGRKFSSEFSPLSLAGRCPFYLHLQGV